MKSKLVENTLGAIATAAVLVLCETAATPAVAASADRAAGQLTGIVDATDMSAQRRGYYRGGYGYRRGIYGARLGGYGYRRGIYGPRWAGYGYRRPLYRAAYYGGGGYYRPWGYGYRARYARPYYNPYYAAYPAYPAYYPSYYYRPHFAVRPVFGIGFGFGPRVFW
jgi:hypothetical protein